MESIRTIQYIRELRASGISQEQAEAQVIALEKALTDLATKSDLKTEIALVRQDLKTEIALVRQDLKTEIALVRQDLKTEIALVRQELKDIVNDLKWFVVYVVVGTVMATFAFPVLAGLVVNAVSKWIGKI